MGRTPGFVLPPKFPVTKAVVDKIRKADKAAGYEPMDVHPTVARVIGKLGKDTEEGR